MSGAGRLLVRCWARDHDIGALAEELANLAPADRTAALVEITEAGGETLARDLKELLRRQELIPR